MISISILVVTLLEFSFYYELKLVLLTPETWLSVSLPPYNDQPDKLIITFDQFRVFFTDDSKTDEGNGTLYLFRKGYLDFLKDLRQHFKLVKSGRIRN